MTQIFSFEALPARKGDALILHFGTQEDPKLAIVDGGPSKVFQPSLRPRLKDIRAARGLQDTTALPVDLLMISHIDDDHIIGILELTKELKKSKSFSEPSIVKVATLWHNTFDDIIGNTEFSAGTASVLASMGEEDFGEDFDHDIGLILASVRQGRDLRKDAKAFEWEVNNPFTPLVMIEAPDDPPVTRFGGGLEITVLGPRKEELEDLQKRYDDFLEDKGLGRDSQEALLAAGQDKSVPNLSSIVALVTVRDKSVLLTGDALGSNIEEALEMRGLASANDPLKVNILKLQHHGSDRNVTPSFFQTVKADHYVFCGDGAHGNPERATIEMLFSTHDGAPITLHFSNPIDKIDAQRKEEKDKHAQKNKAKGRSFEFWDNARDSLQALFDAEEANRNFSVNASADRTGIQIHLLDSYVIPRHDD